MKKMFLTTAIAVSALSAAAQLSPPSAQRSFQRELSPTGLVQKELQPAPAAPMLAPLATEADQQDYCTITLKFESDQPGYHPWDSYIVGDGGILALPYSGSNIMKATLPAGTYDIVACFTPPAAFLMQPDLDVVEGVEVTGDTTIVVNNNRINHTVRMTSLRRDGTPVVIPGYAANGDLLNAPTCSDMWISYQLIRKDVGIILSFFVNAGVSQEDADGNLTWDSDLTQLFHASDMSDNYVLRQLRIALAYEGYEITDLTIEGCQGDTTVQNNPDLYYDFELEAPNYTPAHYNSDGFDNPDNRAFDMNFSAYWGQNPPVTNSLWLGRAVEDGKPFVIDYCPDASCEPDDLRIGIKHRWVDAMTPSTSGSSEPIGQFVTLPEILPMANGIYASIVTTANRNMGADKDHKFPTEGYPYCKAFLFTSDHKLQKYNDNVPVLLSLPTATDISSRFVGRYSELRDADPYFCASTAYFNGEKTFDSTTDGPLDYYLKKTLAKKEGILEVNYLNTNISVDGMSGSNATTITMDLAKEDHMAPVLAMLQFTDTDSNVTDRFTRAENGRFRLAACDYSMEDAAYGMKWYNPQPELSITVEYAPAGTDTFKPLAVEEMPELSYRPGFDRIFDGSLEEVNVASPNLWYDLRVSLADASGNKCVQTLSPAFRIDTPSSVEMISANDSETTYYDLMGNRVAAPTSGLYIKVANGAATKVRL